MFAKFKVARLFFMLFYIWFYVPLLSSDEHNISLHERYKLFAKYKNLPGELCQDLDCTKLEICLSLLFKQIQHYSSKNPDVFQTLQEDKNQLMKVKSMTSSWFWFADWWYATEQDKAHNNLAITCIENLKQSEEILAGHPLYCQAYELLSFYMYRPAECKNFVNWIFFELFPKDLYPFMAYKNRIERDLKLIHDFIGTEKFKDYPHVIHQLEELEKYLQGTLPFIQEEYNKELQVYTKKKEEDEQKDLARRTLLSQEQHIAVLKAQNVLEEKKIKVDEQLIGQLAKLDRNLDEIGLLSFQNLTTLQLQNCLDEVCKIQNGLEVKKNEKRILLDKISILEKSINRQIEYKKLVEKRKILEKDLAETQESVTLLTGQMHALQSQYYRYSDPKTQVEVNELHARVHSVKVSLEEQRKKLARLLSHADVPIASPIRDEFDCAHIPQAHAEIIPEPSAPPYEES